ncbi:MAG TPA: hypothetical protein VEK32_01840, partial [Thermodesulfobacteriota bacterium]|nr:hypothetical protein [Thermodesulfobacteriota bacterium]
WVSFKEHTLKLEKRFRVIMPIVSFSFRIEYKKVKNSSITLRSPQTDGCTGAFSKWVVKDKYLKGSSYAFCC